MNCQRTHVSVNAVFSFFLETYVQIQNNEKIGKRQSAALTKIERTHEVAAELTSEYTITIIIIIIFQFSEYKKKSFLRAIKLRSKLDLLGTTR